MLVAATASAAAAIAAVVAATVAAAVAADVRSANAPAAAASAAVTVASENTDATAAVTHERPRSYAHGLLRSPQGREGRAAKAVPALNQQWTTTRRNNKLQ